MIIVDVHEPHTIEDLIAQSLPTARMSLNTKGYADYLWHDVLGLVNQVERKQIDEILSSIDAVEEQLRREINRADRTYLLCEGTFEALAGNKVGCQSFRKAKGGTIMVPGHKYNISYSGVQAWFDQLDRAGITIINTIDYKATAMVLVALYNNHQKIEHTTLQRYIKQRVYPKPFNPYVETLMGIKGGYVGADIAQSIIDKYVTPWCAFQQSAEQLAETMIGKKRLGLARAKKILKSVGKEV